MSEAERSESPEAVCGRQERTTPPRSGRNFWKGRRIGFVFFLTQPRTVGNRIANCNYCAPSSSHRDGLSLGRCFNACMRREEFPASRSDG